MKPELSIIITSYKNPGLLELCITSLEKHIRGIGYEIIVADSETGKDTAEMMGKKFPNIIFFPNRKNTGYGFLVNQGIKIAKGDYFLVINADIIIENQTAVRELFSVMKARPEIGMVGPRLVNGDGSIQPSCFRFYTPLTVIYRRTFLNRCPFAKRHLRQFLMEDQNTDEGLVEADWLMGSAVMVSRAAYEKVGMIDTERYFMYFEDVDWCWRFWEKGYKVIYYPQVQVKHLHGKASRSQNALKAVLFNRYTRIHILSALKFFLKYLGKQNPHEAYHMSR